MLIGAANALASPYDPLALIARQVEGTLIMARDDWGSPELNEDTVRTMGLYGKCRTWVELSNCFY